MRRVRQKDQRGATAVVVALLLVVLTGFTALAVDIGAVRWDQKQLQNGADAAALAVAQDCAAGDCGDENDTATGLAQANTPGTGADSVGVTFPTSNSVRVELEATRQHWFAPVLGIDSTEVPASATATWGAPGSMGTVPITVSQCALERALADGELDNPSNLILLFTKDKGGKDKNDESDIDKKNKDDDEDADEDDAPENPCDTTNGPHVVPGGFQWLVPDSGCNVVTDLNSQATSSTGNTNPKACDEDEMNTLMRGEEVLLPVYSKVEGQGSKAQYTIASYAAMHVETYCLTNKVQSIEQPYRTEITGNKSKKKCTGSERWIEGYFLRHVALDAELGTDAGSPDYGVTTVRLTK